MDGWMDVLSLVFMSVVLTRSDWHHVDDVSVRLRLSCKTQLSSSSCVCETIHEIHNQYESGPPIRMKH